MKKALFIAIVLLMDTESAMLNALNIGADDGRKTANGTEKGKTIAERSKSSDEKREKTTKNDSAQRKERQ